MRTAHHNRRLAVGLWAAAGAVGGLLALSTGVPAQVGGEAASQGPPGGSGPRPAFVASLSAPEVAAGSKLGVVATGFRPGSEVAVALARQGGRAPGSTVGTFRAGRLGRLDVWVKVPTGYGPGLYVVHVSGQAPRGAPLGDQVALRVLPTWGGAARGRRG